MIGIGIDVSKSKSTIAAMVDTGEIIMKPKEFKHTQNEISKLIEWIKTQEGTVFVVMESTGHYHYPVLKKLYEEGIYVSVVNAYLMKKYGDIEIRKAKTDKKDAIRIAKYAIEKRFNLKRYESEDEKYNDLKFLSRQYNQTVSIRVKVKIQLNNLLDEIMPGINMILTRTTNNSSKILYDFVEKFEHFEKIRCKSEQRFIKEYSAWSKKKGYRNGAIKALKIYELAQNSITTRSDNSSTQIALKNCIKILRETEESSNSILTQMQTIAYTLPEYKIVRALKGVGDKLAPRLIAEIGDVRKFTSAKALNAYAGNDAPPYQSGQFEGSRRHISKRGSASLRKVGYEVMMALKITKPSEDNAVYEFMIKKESEGKAKNVAKMAALNKFLRIYYTRVINLYKNL
ncbi:IS110 family transposase [Clostridium botulinum]|uniref:IS110 family transposase n=1 Tax=Clostridium botulinum TaxID=1491 RepID=UPI0013C8D6F3|nr:IS110 family transposase [Clostridium botulinum]MBY7024820.1 IS110 family transposase [Clostridium botulinum]NFN19703.1 IS110 family transposase [Clostridium botulinum]NFN48374.1 IS110 family transposase [Clostridium botulinum]